MSAPNETPGAMPDGIDPAHLRTGSAIARHASPLSLLVLLAVVGLGASGWLGKPWPERSHATGAVDLSVAMPTVVSTGDLYEALIEVHANTDISRLQIEVDPHLWTETTINSMVPAADSETFKDGRIRFGFDALAQGEALIFKVDAQINPRFFGRLAGDIRVLDDGRLIAASRRELRVMP
ncbi:hypothetical protein QTH91_15915 [Variovorax dokdonensis]|uniref:Uncharacterized protein n=1 Tax=Variovorax dokdonensis TaxID=344883 RepID=A0ABT7NDE4_9BURK|nr:hypothetical protein [Variovorax dokdonensis]MDM0045975.1 hypothetical protein [Variovorax dokdonensis]